MKNKRSAYVYTLIEPGMSNNPGIIIERILEINPEFFLTKSRQSNTIRSLMNYLIRTDRIILHNGKLYKNKDQIPEKKLE